ncbi:MAG: HAD family hydrolase [Ileibacterium sp.]|nr:HAD family hydrolase [Ileibacterium sp.]
MKPVTLVVTDLDGTLLDSNKNVSEKTKEAIKQLKNHGILFGIASGRPVESGIILCQKWGLADDISFLVGMNGGAMYDMRRKEKESYADMDGELIWKIIDEYNKLNLPDLHYEVMVGNDRYVEWSSEETLANAALYGENEIIVDLEQFLKGRRVDKLIIRSLPETQPALVEKAKTLNLANCSAFPTSDVLFEFVNPEINKGYGIQRVCEHYGLNLENIVAFGDEANDMQMLSLAGTGVAMQNAVPAVKHISDVVSEYTNDQDALAHFIDEVIIPNAEGKLDQA